MFSSSNQNVDACVLVLICLGKQQRPVTSTQLPGRLLKDLYIQEGKWVSQQEKTSSSAPMKNQQPKENEIKSDDTTFKGLNSNYCCHLIVPKSIEIELFIHYLHFYLAFSPAISKLSSSSRHLSQHPREVGCVERENNYAKGTSEFHGWMRTWTWISQIPLHYYSILISQSELANAWAHGRKTLSFLNSTSNPLWFTACLGLSKLARCITGNSSIARVEARLRYQSNWLLSLEGILHWFLTQLAKYFGQSCVCLMTSSG